MINGIFACDQTGGIGKGNKLPWDSPRDMKHFLHVTKGNTVVMGRKTWDSLPTKPLPHRKNIVITSDPLSYDHGMDIEAAKEFLENTQDEVFIIGGSEIFKTLEQYVEYWYITVVAGNFDCDTKFAPSLKDFVSQSSIAVQDKNLHLSFKEYKRAKKK